MKTRRTFSTEEKLSILREGSENGVHPTLEKHGIYPAIFYSWRKKFNEMGEDGLSHGMTPAHLKRIRELEKENQKLKELVAEERVAGKLKDELLKKEMGLGEKKQTVMQYNSQGLQLRTALPIAGISESSRKPSENGMLIRGGNTQRISNEQMIQRIQSIQKDLDLVYAYHCMTKQLQQESYRVNHKKV